MLIYYVYAYLRLDGRPYYIGKGKSQRAFDRHGRIKVPKDPWRIVLLEQNLTEFGALALERRMIRWYGRKDMGTGILYNLTDGGEGCSGLIHTEEHKRKVGEASRNRVFSEESRRKRSIALKGRKFSEETLQKMSLAAKGRKLSEEHKRKISGKGRSHSEDTKRKIGEANKISRRGKKLSEETIAKIRAFNSGKILSEEHKRKISESHRKRRNPI